MPTGSSLERAASDDSNRPIRHLPPEPALSMYFHLATRRPLRHVSASAQGDSNRAASRTRRGMTLLEVMLALSMLAIGLVAMTSTTLATHRLKNSDTERQIAVAAVEALVRDVEVLANATDKEGSDWASQIIQAFAPPGDEFGVTGLEIWPTETAVLQIEFVTDETETDASIGFGLGMPRDLDNDGLSDNTDASSTARMLPVIVRARWNGEAGLRELVHGFYVLGY